MLNAAVIGCGAMGKSHVRVYSEIDGVRLVAASDPKKETAADMERKYRIPCYDDYRIMLDKERIDIVSIVVPTTLHKEVALECISRGISVLIEKPIASTTEEAEEIIQAAKQKGVRLMVGHIERFNPAVVELKRRIKAGELGKVYKIDANREGPFPPRISDVGVIIDLAVHDIDIMRFILEDEPTRVYAETAQRLHSKCEDVLCSLLRFREGAVGNLNVNWVTPTKIRRLYVTGEKGMFMVDYLSQDVYFYQNKDLKITEYSYILQGVAEGSMTKFFIAKKEPLRGELEHFIASVENDREPSVTGQDGIMALKIAQKMIESAAGQKLVQA